MLSTRFLSPPQPQPLLARLLPLLLLVVWLAGAATSPARAAGDQQTATAPEPPVLHLLLPDISPDELAPGDAAAVLDLWTGSGAERSRERLEPRLEATPEGTLVSTGLPCRPGAGSTTVAIVSMPRHLAWTRLEADECATAEDGMVVRELSLHPRATLTLRLLPPDGVRSGPEGLAVATLRLEPCPDAAADERDVVELPVVVDAEGFVVTPVPSRCFAARVLAEGFEPAAWDPVAPQPGERMGIAPRRLELEARATGLAGRVVDAASEPLAGVRGLVRPTPTRPGETPRPRPFVTDDGGGFAVDLGATGGSPAGGETPAVNVALETPDGGLALFRREPGAGITLTVPDGGGPVRLILPFGAGRYDPVTWWLVAEDGAWLDARLGATGPAADGGGVASVFPRLAPGVWHLVRATGPREAFTVQQGRGRTLPAAAVFEPVAGEEVVVDGRGAGATGETPR